MDYERAIGILGLDEWPLLKQHLDSEVILHSEQVLAALKTYVIAFQAYREARDRYEELKDDHPCDDGEPFDDYRDELNRLRSVYDKALNLKNVLYRVLVQMLGEEV